MPLASTCRHCQEPFTPVRAGAQYCSGRCRTAAYRVRQAPPPITFWNGAAPAFSAISRSTNADGTPTFSKAELAEQLLEITATEDGGAPKTARRLFYLALSHGLIRPDMSASDEARRSRDRAYKRITETLGDMRRAGKLEWDAVLDLTRELDQWQVFESPREARARMRQGYDEDRWIGQLYFPILLVEKDTIEPVCRPIAWRWQMPFASSRGYGSLTLQHDVATLLNQRRSRLGQPAIVYFVSDLDPSGLDLQRAWYEALQNFDVSIAKFVRIGLTPAQVAAHDLDRFAIEVKISDSRSKSFIEQYGNKCWEADVLQASVIEQEINRNIRGWLDNDAWQRRHAEIDQARSLL